MNIPYEDSCFAGVNGGSGHFRSIRFGEIWIHERIYKQDSSRVYNNKV